ncbi:hypothetical protein Zmor_008892 [Zophobas morio]|uniref:Uncharacterized protein n=1 Tax=Zophobas morio TaxID=2755281 RepID=A0AA38HIG5_9CUCU|nr:hypothetical protein Zmor_008892 [Zophobas morio]
MSNTIALALIQRLRSGQMINLFDYRLDFRAFSYFDDLQIVSCIVLALILVLARFGLGVLSAWVTLRLRLAPPLFDSASNYSRLVLLWYWHCY